MTKRIAAIMVCAVMVLVAAAPLALATHDIIKGAQGPRASAKTWTYEPASVGNWTGHIENNGLRSLVVDVADNTTGVPMNLMHQRIRFAVYNAVPTGAVDTSNVTMAAGHLYEITVTPNGPQGSSCTVDDVFVPAPPPLPVAAFTATPNGLTVSVDASASSGSGLSYAWNWGDGTADGTGMTATHTYAKPVVASTSSLSGKARPPGVPHTIYGYTYASDGVTPLGGCDVVITDRNTSGVIVTTSTLDGVYSVDLTEMTIGWSYNDTLIVNATRGTMTGSNQGLITDNPDAFDQIDVTLIASGGSAIVTITLTVTDTLGQTDSVSQQVTISW